MQNSQGNACARVSFKKLQATLFNKRLRHKAFSCEFCEIFKYTFFTEHLRATASNMQIFLLRVSLESKIWEKWLHVDEHKKISCFNFWVMKPNFNYWKCLWYELTCKMACIVQCITVNGKNLEKKRKQSLDNSCLTLKITAPK